MANGGSKRDDREARERARLYQARQSFHEGKARRRVRDNIIAGIVGGVLVLVVAGVQTAYFVAGPGKPVPTPTPTPTPAATMPAPTESPAQTPLDTPSPTPAQ